MIKKNLKNLSQLIVVSAVVYLLIGIFNLMVQTRWILLLLTVATLVFDEKTFEIFDHEKLTDVQVDNLKRLKFVFVSFLAAAQLSLLIVKPKGISWDTLLSAVWTLFMWIVIFSMVMLIAWFVKKVILPKK